jgi:hypothetical protein
MQEIAAVTGLYEFVGYSLVGRNYGDGDRQRCAHREAAQPVATGSNPPLGKPPCSVNPTGPPATMSSAAAGMIRI